MQKIPTVISHTPVNFHCELFDFVIVLQFWLVHSLLLVRQACPLPSA